MLKPIFFLRDLLKDLSEIKANVEQVVLLIDKMNN